MHDFDFYNSPESYDLIREEPLFRKDETGNVCRLVEIDPADVNDPREERQKIVVSGVLRVASTRERTPPTSWTIR
jgi:hypothetical protein